MVNRTSPYGPALGLGVRRDINGRVTISCETPPTRTAGSRRNDPSREAASDTVHSADSRAQVESPLSQTGSAGDEFRRRSGDVGRGGNQDAKRSSIRSPSRQGLSVLARRPSCRPRPRCPRSKRLLAHVKHASNFSDSEEDEHTKQKQTVYVLPSCFPYVETTLETRALEARMEQEKEKNGALEVTLQEAVAAQMYLEARVQLERRVRNELAELQEENEAARDALEGRLQEEIEKGSVLAANLRGNEAARLALQARVEEEKQWSGALTGRLGVQREALEAREEREKRKREKRAS